MATKNSLLTQWISIYRAVIVMVLSAVMAGAWHTYMRVIELGYQHEALTHGLESLSKRVLGLEKALYESGINVEPSAGSE